MERRTHIRYAIGPEERVQCRLNRCPPEDRWRPVVVSNESFSGCLLFLDEQVEVDLGEMIQVDFGHGYTSEAVVTRVEPLAANRLRLGCRFIV